MVIAYCQAHFLVKGFLVKNPCLHFNQSFSLPLLLVMMLEDLVEHFVYYLVKYFYDRHPGKRKKSKEEC